MLPQFAVSSGDLRYNDKQKVKVLFHGWRFLDMTITVDGISTELKHGESLLDAVKKLELDSISLRKRPLAAQIGGEVFSLRYTPFKDCLLYTSPAVFCLHLRFQRAGLGNTYAKWLRFSVRHF